jgi:hypothetical protein
MDITTEFSGGPGGQLQPWVSIGATISYSGCVLVPSNVPGGDTGSGTINTSALYINGILFSPYQLPVASVTTLGGVKVDGQSITIANGVISASAGGAAGISVGAAPPATPSQGALWWDSVGGQLYVYYNDGDSSQWVTVVNQGFGGTYLPLAGGQLTGALAINMIAGQARSYFGQTSGFNRWELQLGDTTAESGSSAGSNLNLISYSDTGVKQTILNINRATGTTTFDAPLVLAADPITPFQAATKEYVDNKSVISLNRIINGDMSIDQRNNGASGTAINVYTVDRWQFNAAQTGKGTWGQTASGTALTQFYYSLAFTSSSAYALLASDFFTFVQKIEANMINDFAWGTTQAQPATLSFWAFSSLSGTFGGSIRNFANTRSYPFSYALVANTWTKVVIPIPGDTSGTWVMTGSAGALVLGFDLGSGATFRGPAGAWITGNYSGATGTVAVVSTNAANFYITGVKLEIGNQATAFQRKTYQENLANCQRYYQTLGGGPSNTFGIQGYSSVASGIFSSTVGYNLMRAAPTATPIGSFTSTNAGTVNLYAGLQTMLLQVNPPAIGGFAYYNTGTAIIALSAEL